MITVIELDEATKALARAKANERQDPIVCECGTTVKKSGLYAHKKSTKHTTLMTNLQPTVATVVQV